MDGSGGAHGQRLQADRLAENRAEISLFLVGIVGVIEADALPEIAAGFIETMAQNPGAGFDVGAEIIA
jgi:hypothetical protein